MRPRPGNGSVPGERRAALTGSFPSPPPPAQAMVCFGDMFIELPKARTKEMLQKGKGSCTRGSACT